MYPIALAPLRQIQIRIIYQNRFVDVYGKNNGKVQNSGMSSSGILWYVCVV